MIWKMKEIIDDLKELEKKGEEPDIFQLKRKYGYEDNSKFFPLLELIRTEGFGLDEFIEGIFKRVKDHRDLLFRYGECFCRACRDD